MEWGAEIPDQYSVQELVAAREKAGVAVIGLCTPAGVFSVFKHHHCMSTGTPMMMSPVITKLG